MKLLTFGHGTASADELAALIRDAGIAEVVDVRTVPKSRLHPQARREELETWVPQLSGAVYRWSPELGGFRKPTADSPNVALRNTAFRGYADYMETERFAQGMAQLLDGAAQRQVAIMCSESLWWRCHRRLVSDALVLLHQVDVEHLAHTGKASAHVPTAGVRVLNATQLRYDVLT